MPVFNSDERVTGHFLYQDHVIGCQRIKALQVALENLSRSASSISSTGLPRQIPMSLRSDSSSSDMTFAGTGRVPLCGYRFCKETMRYPAAQQGQPLATKDSENYVGTGNEAQYGQ